MTLFTIMLTTLVAAQAPTAPAKANDDIEGRWRLKLTLPVVQTAPVIGDLERSFEMSALVDVRRDGRRLVQRTRACDVEIGGGGFATRVEVPGGFLDAIRVPPSPVVRAPGRVSTVLRGIHLGYAPREPGDAPPKTPDAPTVRDSDKDGHPGVTVILHVFEIGRIQLFVAQHLHLRLEGRRVSPTLFEGAVRVVEFQQHLLDSEPAVRGLAEDLVTRARDGRFTMERVADDAGCGA